MNLLFHLPPDAPLRIVLSDPLQRDMIYQEHLPGARGLSTFHTHKMHPSWDTQVISVEVAVPGAILSIAGKSTTRAPLTNAPHDERPNPKPIYIYNI